MQSFPYHLLCNARKEVSQISIEDTCLPHMHHGIFLYTLANDKTSRMRRGNEQRLQKNIDGCLNGLQVLNRRTDFSFAAWFLWDSKINIGLGANFGRGKAHDLSRRHGFGECPSVSQWRDEIENFKEVFPVSDGYLSEIFSDLLSHNFWFWGRELKTSTLLSCPDGAGRPKGDQLSRPRQCALWARECAPPSAKGEAEADVKRTTGAKSVQGQRRVTNIWVRPDLFRARSAGFSRQIAKGRSMFSMFSFLVMPQS